jgi:hypothetical protein
MSDRDAAILAELRRVADLLERLVRMEDRGRRRTAKRVRTVTTRAAAEVQHQPTELQRRQAARLLRRGVR